MLMPFFCNWVEKMKYGDKAKLCMKKSILMDGKMDSKIFSCRVLTYEQKEECVYLVLQNDLLQNVSLDSIYECEIETQSESISCTGTVKERFYNEYGKILKLQIKNGFYKISVKSVDKQKA